MTKSVKQVAEELGVKPKWVRARIASGVITPERLGSKRNGRFLLSDAETETLRVNRWGAEAPDTLDLAARVERLESDRANLLAHVAWARAIAQERGAALEAERQNSVELRAALEEQRARVERLKSLSPLDRLLGRHKPI